MPEDRHADKKEQERVQAQRNPAGEALVPFFKRGQGHGYLFSVAMASLVAPAALAASRRVTTLPWAEDWSALMTTVLSSLVLRASAKRPGRSWKETSPSFR